MAVKHTNSIEKNMKQLAVVAKEPFMFGGQLLEPPKKLVLSDTFWREYKCFLNCGACCLAFSLDFLPYEWFKLEEQYGEQKAGRWQMVQANGRTREVISIVPEPSQKWCSFLQLSDGRCMIHDRNPFNCQVELIKFKRVGECGYIQKAPYGRGWNMLRIDGERGAVCEFGQLSIEQLLVNDVPTLKKMLRWANYWHIATWLPEVLTLIDIAIEEERFDRVVVAVTN